MFWGFTPVQFEAKHYGFCMHYGHSHQIDEPEVGCPISHIFFELSRVFIPRVSVADDIYRFLIKSANETNKRWKLVKN